MLNIPSALVRSLTKQKCSAVTSTKRRHNTAAILAICLHSILRGISRLVVNIAISSVR